MDDQSQVLDQPAGGIEPILQAILVELKTIVAQTAPKPDPLRAESDLIAEIHRITRGKTFTGQELLIYGSLIPGTSDDDKESLHSLVVEALGALSVRRLGIFLSKYEGQPLSGFIIRRDGQTRAGAAWKILRESSNSKTHKKTAPLSKSRSFLNG